MQTVRFTFHNEVDTAAPDIVVYGTTSHTPETLRDMNAHLNEIVEQVGHVMGLALFIDFVEPVNAKEA